MIIQIFIFAVIAFLIYHFILRSDRSSMPPGEFGLPIIGKFPPKDKHITSYIEDYRKIYGDIFSWKIGSRTFVVICNHALVKQAYNSLSMADRPEFYSIMNFSLGKPCGVIEANGIHWQNTRRFTTRFLKDRGMGKSSYFPEIEQEAKNLVEDFENHLNKKSELPWSLNVAVLNVTWKLTANKRYDVSDARAQNILKMINDMFDSFQGYVLLIDMMPWIRHIIKGPIKKALGITKFHERIDELYVFLREVVAEATDVSASAQSTSQNIIQAYYAEMENKDSEFRDTFSDEDLLVILADLFTTGSDSTATTLKWIILFIAKYPEVRKKMQAEIDANVPSDRFLQYEDKENLPYTYAVYQEVLRLMPLLPISLYHSANEDTFLDKYKIPKDTIIIASTLSLHKDPKYWKKPDEFYPEHFLNEDGSLKTVTEGFIPFSLGRRSCIGELLARIQIFLMVTSLVQVYDFHEIPEDPLDIMTLHPSQILFNLPIDRRITITKRIFT